MPPHHGVKIYGDSQSGNCYKVKLVLSLLGIAHEWRHIDILNGDTKQAGFLALNPNGKSLYAYPHVAHQGGFGLARYPHIQRWIAQIREQPAYVGMAD